MKKVFIPIVVLIIGLFAGYYWGKSSCKTSPLINSDYHVNGNFDFKNLPDNEKASIEKFYDTASFKLADRNDESHPIDKRLAFQLIRAFQHQNEGTIMPFPVRTAHGRARGYFIDRKPIEQILANPAWSGISVFFAKDQSAPTGSKRIYTLIYMGGRYNAGKDTIFNALKKDQRRLTGDGSDTLAFDFVKPCPTVCSDFDSHEPPPSVVATHPKVKGKK